MYSGTYPVSGESGQQFAFNAFDEKEIRLAFIKKVYGILSIQLLVSFAFTIIPLFSDDVRLFAVNNTWLLFVAIAISFGSLITLACCDVHRNYPTNYICLGLFTLAESFLLLVVGAASHPHAVVYAVITTAIVCVALTAFAHQTKIDFTVFNGLMFVLLIVLIVMGLIMAIWPSKIMDTVYAALGAFIFSAYLVIDTQMIVGGSHKYQFSPEDYVFAAITLYVDIINLFLMILRLFNINRE